MIEYEDLTSKQKILYDWIMTCVPEKPEYDEDTRIFIKALEMLIHGVAGAGKTTLVALLVRDLMLRGYRVFMTAPTHKAAQQMEKTFNGTNLISAPPVRHETLSDGEVVTTKVQPTNFKPAFIGTIHSALGLKMDSEEDTRTLTASGQPKTSSRNKWNNRIEYKCDLLMCDEGSMVSQPMRTLVQERQAVEKFHVVYIGDKYQLEAPDDEEGALSTVFDIDTPTILDEVTRQAADSPIIKFSIACREKIDFYEGRRDDNPPFSFSTYIDNDIINTVKEHQAIDKYLELIEHDIANAQHNRILSFTNDRVDAFNRVIRKKLLGADVADYVPGEILVLQDASAKLTFSNNEEVRILSVWEDTEVIEMPLNINEKGNVVDYREHEFDCFRVKVCKLDDEETTETLCIMNRSNREEFDRWMSLFAKKYRQMKTGVNKRAAAAGWKAFWEAKSRYPGIKYGFAQTVHKSQGSTFKNVIFDLATTKPYLKSRPTTAWRLIYVAATRPSEKVFFLV